MPASRDAIVLVHGLGSKERDFAREQLLQGLLQVPESATVTQQSPVAVQGVEGLQLLVTHAEDGAQRQLDLYEAFWGDLAPSLAQADIKTRMLGGLELLPYWLLSGVWRGIAQRKALTVSMLVGMFLLVAWYWSTLALFFTAVGQDPSLLGAGTPAGLPVPTSTGTVAGDLLKQVSTWLGIAGAWMGGWRVWAAVSIIVGLLPVNGLVDIADFARRYLTDARMGENPVGLRSKLRLRINGTLRAVVESGHYSRVTVVAHSMGTAIAVDVLANYRSPSKTQLRLVTLGGPLELLARRAKWVTEEIESCVQNPRVTQWADFYSKDDWFCTQTPFTNAEPRLTHTCIEQRASFGSRLSGATHYRYLVNPTVLALLLTRPPPPALAPVEQEAG
ncbi:lipase family protein [Myxococcus stipitatus]|uniref:lipase family protein n=1 Tax=Myxococcus stipitatus TaxID=83455 RepID=UPI001F21871A|nr:lipase family protein [Myxococcus stipitatus]MCE9672157.1 lipase family protein [Myxococcus stipitatus]